MRRRRLVLAAAIAAVTVLAVVGTALSHSAQPQNSDSELNQSIRKAFLARTHSATAAPSDIVLQQFTLLGHSDLGGGGVEFADLWVHKDYAYVGTRCRPSGGQGVKVANIARPTAPTLVSTLPTELDTRAEDVVVISVSTPSFTGDLAVVGIQSCQNQAQSNNGLKFFDVTQPASPQLLSTWTLPPSWGCHEVDLVQRANDGKVLAACARNLNDQRTQTGAPIPNVALQLVDATNPRAPVEVSTWWAPWTQGSGTGCSRLVFAHSARFAKGGAELYVSYWDLGTIRLDIADPAAPAPKNNIAILPGDEDGDSHSVGYANRSKWLVVNPEDFSPEFQACQGVFGGWGEAHVFDVANPASPAALATFATPNGAAGRTDGVYTVHNTESIAKDLFSSWYSDGIVWWTVDGPNAARQIGQFVPPASALEGIPMVWGVAVDRAHRAVLASDMGNGLWLVRPKQPGT